MIVASREAIEVGMKAMTAHAFSDPAVKVEAVISAMIPHLEIAPAPLTGEQQAIREDRIREEAFNRGHAIGVEEAELSGPTEYERWRDAMMLTVQLAKPDAGLAMILNPEMRVRFTEAAVWFHVNLGIPPGEGDPGWPHEGARHESPLADDPSDGLTLEPRFKRVADLRKMTDGLPEEMPVYLQTSTEVGHLVSHDTGDCFDPAEGACLVLTAEED